MVKLMHTTYLKTKAKGSVTLWIEHLIIKCLKAVTYLQPSGLIMSRLTIGDLCCMAEGDLNRNGKSKMQT